MTAHDLRHPGAVRRPAGRCVDHLGGVAEILWPDRGRRDQAEHLHVLAAVVVEAVNGAARNAERLSRPDVEALAVHSPGQHPFDAVDRFFVVFVAVRRRRQTLRGRDRQLEQGDAPTRVVSRDQEAHTERPEMDGLVGGIDLEVSRLRCHRVGPVVNCVDCQDSKRDLSTMSRPPSLASAPVKTKDMLIGALLRVPAQAIQRRIISELNAAGFEELRVPHMAVLQFPGPDGVRPGLLAERAGMSKQAMNQLLRSLEGLGYLVRSDAPDEGRARVVRLTRRGRAAYAKIHDILRDIEREWSAVLGPRRFAALKRLLLRVWESPLVREPAGPGRANASIPDRGHWSAARRTTDGGPPADRTGPAPRRRGFADRPRIPCFDRPGAAFELTPRGAVAAHARRLPRRRKRLGAGENSADVRSCHSEPLGRRDGPVPETLASMKVRVSSVQRTASARDKRRCDISSSPSHG